jgi:hypothetical protein
MTHLDDAIEATRHSPDAALYVDAGPALAALHHDVRRLRTCARVHTALLVILVILSLAPCIVVLSR